MCMHSRATPRKKYLNGWGPYCCFDVCSGVSARRPPAAIRPPRCPAAPRPPPIAARPPAVRPPGPHGPHGSFGPYGLHGPMESPGTILCVRGLPEQVYGPPRPIRPTGTIMSGTIIWVPPVNTLPIILNIDPYVNVRKHSWVKSNILTPVSL